MNTKSIKKNKYLLFENSISTVKETRVREGSPFMIVLKV